MKRGVLIALVAGVLVAGGLLGKRAIDARKAAAAPVAASTGAAAAPGATGAPGAPRAQPVVELAPADLSTARAVELSQGLPVSGSLKAVNSALVKARIAGELRELNLREGDSVKAGQVVARIDAADAQARLKQAQEQADSARTQIDIAQRQWDNNKALVDQGFISRTALDTSWNNFVAAQANHKAALAAVDVARKAVDDAVLVAPIGGLVSQRLAQNGERVAVDARVLEIVDIRELELEAAIPPSDSPALRVGQTARLNIEGLSQPVAARVVRINPSAQAGSRAVLAYLKLDSAAGLRQGLFAQGTLDTARKRTLAVPLSSVRTDKPAPYVQIVDQGVVRHVAVQPGERGQATDGSGTTLVAVGGLAEGAQVIAGSAGALREGTPVRMTGPAR